MIDMLSFFSSKKRNRPNDKRARLVSFRSKHSVARQSVISDVASIVSAVRVLHPIAETLCRPSEYSIQSRKHSVGRHNVLSCRSKYSVARRDASSNRESILSRVRVLYSIGAYIMSRVIMLYPIEASTLSADRVLHPIAETLCRPTECYFL